MPLADASSWGPPLNPEWLTTVGNTLYFTATNTPDGTTPWLGRELWKSDGAAAGTVSVRSGFPGASNPSGPSNFANVGGSLYFVANDGRNLWY